MSALDPELVGFLDVLTKVLQHDDGQQTPTESLSDDDPVQNRLAEAGALDLGVDTAEMDDGLRWLVEVVARAAQHAPAVGYVLAARYVAQRALLRLGHSGGDRWHDSATAVLASEPTGGSALGPSGQDPVEVVVTVAQRFAPDRVVAISPDEDRVTIGSFETAGADGTGPRRTGLSAALLAERTIRDGEQSTGDDARTTRHEWDLLIAAVAIGTAEGAAAAATLYAREREQFGTRLIDFAGLRAILGEMELRTRQGRALLETALAAPESAGAHRALAAASGRAAVDQALDAIQVLGGYGYIEEYPVATFMRDAVSIRARATPRRHSVGNLVQRNGAPS